MGDGKHLWTHVNADNGPSLAQAFFRQPGNDAGSASDVEDAVPRPELDVFENKVGPGPEERAHQRLLVELGETQLGEELLFAPLRRLVAERIFQPFAGLTDIVPAALGEEVVVHGAIALARKKFG